MNHGVHGAHSKKLDENRFASGIDSPCFASLMTLAVPAMFAAVKTF